MKIFKLLLTLFLLIILKNINCVYVEIADPNLESCWLKIDYKEKGSVKRLIEKIFFPTEYFFYPDEVTEIQVYKKYDGKTFNLDDLLHEIEGRIDTDFLKDPKSLLKIYSERIDFTKKFDLQDLSAESKKVSEDENRPDGCAIDWINFI